MNFDLKELWDLWQQGKSINDAIDAFLDCESIKNQVRKKLKNKKPIKNIIDTGLLGERQKQQQIIEFSEYEDEIFQVLYEKIKSEKLLAIGYMEPVGGSDFPDLIPQYFWPPQKVSLEFSSMNFQEGSFSNIRIIENPKRKKDFVGYDSEILPPEIKDKKVGRPSIKDKIIEAYEFLKKEDLIDYSKPLKSHTERIQTTVQKLHPEITDTKGMQHEVIRLTLSRIFQSDKKIAN